jgi:DNA-binding MltR family transcriptional regulator
MAENLQVVPEWYPGLYAELTEESDRGCVAVAAACIDEFLEKAIRAKFSLLSEITKKEADSLLSSKAMAPLGSFGTRIRVAYAIGIIDKETRDAIDNIRAMRNDAGHVVNAITFTDYKWDAFLKAAHPKMIKYLRDNFGAKIKAMPQERGNFILGSILLITRLDVVTKCPKVDTGLLRTHGELMVLKEAGYLD